MFVLCGKAIVCPLLFALTQSDFKQSKQEKAFNVLSLLFATVSDISLVQCVFQIRIP